MAPKMISDLKSKAFPGGHDTSHALCDQSRAHWNPPFQNPRSATDFRMKELTCKHIGVECCQMYWLQIDHTGIVQWAASPAACDHGYMRTRYGQQLSCYLTLCDTAIGMLSNTAVQIVAKNRYYTHNTKNSPVPFFILMTVLNNWSLACEPPGHLFQIWFQ